jgi:hypothetical protein
VSEPVIDMIDIGGLDKAEVLAALHNNTRAVGLGRLHDRGDVTADDVRPQFEDRSRLYFDYVFGRPIKVDLSGDSFDPVLYDRDAGPGSARRAIDELRAGSR